MSAGNGEWHADAEPQWTTTATSAFDAARVVTAEEARQVLAAMAPRSTAQLSARERSEQMDALIAQLETLTREHNALVKAVDGLMARTKATEVDVDVLSTFDRDQDRRIDAIERGAALLSARVRRPFWERVRGRLGL